MTSTPTRSASDAPVRLRFHVPPGLPVEQARRALSSIWLPVLVLVLLPALVFVVPALTGHLYQPGDDFDQNYPLRILAGRLIAGGRLPLLDPYSWGGGPLLGGWNAGAAYPLTGLFAVLPAGIAWAVTEASVYWTAGLGLFAYLRNRGLHPAAALMAAVVFDAGGAMSGQLEHLGLVAGFAWVPLALLALDRLATRLPAPPAPRASLAWSLLLAGAIALIVLAGEPRAIDNAAIVLGAYGLWRLVRARSHRGRLLGSIAGATLLGFVLSAIQWLPGLQAVSQSQRATSGWELFTSGSIHTGWLTLLAVPTLLGGSGSFDLGKFMTGYNFNELASYIGLLPLAGAVGLLGRLRRGRGGPDWLIWPVLAVVGVLLAMGGETPLGGLLHHLPFYGDQRLQSRNLMITDLALAIMFGHWLGGWLRDRPDRRSLRAALVAPISVVVLTLIVLIGGRSMPVQFGADADKLRPYHTIAPMLAGSLALALLVVAYLLWGHRLRVRWRVGLLAALVVVDLTAYIGTAVVRVPTVPPGVPDRVAAAVAPVARPVPLTGSAADIGRTGRFVVYSPHGISDYDLGGVGDPGLNVPRQRYSAQGYSAIVDGHYAAATGTHKADGEGHNTLSLAAVADGTLDQLSVNRLLAPSRSLLTVLTGRSPSRLDNPVTARRTWWFGRSVPVTAVSVPRSNPVRVGLVRPGGSIRFLPAGVDALSAPIRAAGLVVEPVGGSARVAAPTVTVAGGVRLTADRPLQGALATGGWTFAGTLGDYAVFANPHATGPLTARGRNGGRATVRRLSGDALAPASAAVDSSSGAVVTRAVAAIPGWTATWTPADGPAVRLSVHRTGVVQSVTVPAGAGTLRWSYRPPGVRPGLVASTAGLVVVLALGVGLVATRRRPRRSQPS